MKVGIVGLTASGKTTVFDALSGAGAPVATYGGPSSKSHLASVAVPDGRLTKLAELLSPQKVTSAHLDFEDFPGVPLGPGEDRQGGRVLLAQMREVDLLLIVLRAFANVQVPHPFGSKDVARDLAELDAEFLVADQEMVEHRLESLRKTVRKHGKELEEHRRELEQVEQAAAQALQREEPLRALALGPGERPLLRTLASLRPSPVSFSSIPAKSRWENLSQSFRPPTRSSPCVRRWRWRWGNSRRRSAPPTWTPWGFRSPPGPRSSRLATRPWGSSPSSRWPAPK